jgi:hypothetical protein
VSIIDRLPTRRPRPARKHRAADEVDRLKFLLGGANALIKGLGVQLEDQERAHADTVARIDKRHAETVRGLEQQIADLEHRLNIGVLAEHIVAKTQEIPVEQIRQMCAKPVPLHLSPMANPAHVPAWAQTDRGTA